MPRTSNNFTKCNLNMIRQMRGYTQKQLGEYLGVSFQQIQKYEKCKNELSIVSLLQLCSLLEVKCNDIYPEITDLQEKFIKEVSHDLR